MAEDRDEIKTDSIESLMKNHLNLNSSNDILDQILNNLQGLTEE